MLIYSKKRGRAEEVEIECESNKWIITERETRRETSGWEISREDEYWIKAIGCFGSGTNIKGAILGLPINSSVCTPLY